MTYGLTHIAIAVGNIDRTLKFYSNIFDMVTMYHEEKMLQLMTPGTHDILVFEEKRGASIGTSGGIAHFGFRLKLPENIKEIRKRVMAANAKIIDSGEFVPGSPYIFFEDPDGYVIEVWYELPPSSVSD
jgi:catechol 2,3-dioxygenase-like lactoylglutathione lyase family enzyme